ncbi:major facilitator superfamily domain-containing protein [Aspergillus terricola var. indicus]
MATTKPPAVPSYPDRITAISPSDQLNPKDWPMGKKWAVIDVLSATGFNRIMVSTIMAPALSSISHELHMSSTESAMALSIYLLATAIGPLLIGPLSEVYGRKTIMHASNIWFLVWNIVCGFANSKELLIEARFLADFRASAIYALASGVLGDVWHDQERGRSLGAYLLIPLLGAVVGPIIGGFMAGRTTWRWMFWSTSIFQVAMILVSFSVFDETHAPIILRKQAETVRHETGDTRYRTVKERLREDGSPWFVLVKAFSRPLRLLTLHPIIQINSIISAFDYCCIFVELSRLHYIAVALGEMVGSQVTALLMDRLYKRQSRLRAPDPESRLPLTLLGALMAPVGLFLYGWAAAYRLHWAVVGLGIFIALFGLQSTGMPISVAEASQLLRSLTAFCFPLFAPRIYTVLRYG